jgi:CheY-like chemotaxis protein
MDMRMPVMDGYEATKRIKATIQGQATAIVALSASNLRKHELLSFLSVATTLSTSLSESRHL